MYMISRTDYGYSIVISGAADESEARAFIADLVAARTSGYDPQGAIIDLQEMIPADPAVLDIYNQAFQMARQNGLKRLAVVIKSPVVKNQTLQLAFLTETDEIVRVFNASKTEDWEKFSYEWAAHGVEPIYDATFTTAHFFVGKHSAPVR